MTDVGLLDLLRYEWRVNRGNAKGRLVVAAFRLTQCARARRGPFGLPLRLFVESAYRVIVEWGMTIELPAATSVGPGLRIWHGQGLAVNPASRLGADMILRHGVTIGNLRAPRDCPTIGDRVQIGAGAVVIGAITIGDDVVIGPNTVVTTDVPAGSTVFPGRPEIKPRTSREETSPA